MTRILHAFFTKDWTVTENFNGQRIFPRYDFLPGEFRWQMDGLSIDQSKVICLTNKKMKHFYWFVQYGKNSLANNRSSWKDYGYPHLKKRETTNFTGYSEKLYTIKLTILVQTLQQCARYPKLFSGYDSRQYQHSYWIMPKGYIHYCNNCSKNSCSNSIYGIFRVLSMERLLYNFDD